MALFKIYKGLSDNLKTIDKTSEGHCYFTKDDGKFYIDIVSDAAPLTPAENNGAMAGATRIPINSYMSDWAVRAKSDIDGLDIISGYGASLSLSTRTLKLLAKDSTELSSVTIPDERVKQSRSTTSNYRALLMHNVHGAYNTDPGTATGQAYYHEKIMASPSTGDIKATSFTGKLIGNANTATKFSSAQKITLTGAVTGETSSQAGWSVSTTLSDDTVTTAKVVNKAITNAKLANSSITINGKVINLGGTVSLSDIGLGTALRFIGSTTTAIVDGTANNTITINGSSVTAGTGDVVINDNNHQEYVWLNDHWEILGDESSYEIKGTAQDLISKIPTATVLGAGTTFKNSASNVTFGTHTTKSVIGSNATFTVTNPTITVTPTKTNIQAVASGAAVELNTESAITAMGDLTTATFVKSYPGTSKKLVTTSIKGVSGTVGVSAITSNESITATKINSYGTVAILESEYDAATETLIISWTANTVAKGTDVTATKTAYESKTVAIANTSSTTVATGTVDSSGTGSSVLTGLGTATTGNAITAIGTPTTKQFAVSVKSVTNPAVKLSTTSTATSGSTVSVMTGASASASGGAVAFNSKDSVSAITALGAATAAAQTITIGKENITALIQKATT